jgi:hypothetical protein
MAGRVVVSTLNNDTGVLATQNGMTGIAKAWVNFNGTGTIAIRDSFNVSSLTDNGTGNYTVNFTTAMPNANYSSVASGGTPGTRANLVSAPAGTAPTTTALSVLCFDTVGNAQDPSYVCLSIFSS